MEELKVEDVEIISSKLPDSEIHYIVEIALIENKAQRMTINGKEIKQMNYVLHCSVCGRVLFTFPAGFDYSDVLEFIKANKDQLLNMFTYCPKCGHKMSYDLWELDLSELDIKETNKVYEKDGEKRMKYFVVSDMHSFYDELIEALDTSEYDKNNPEHMLIVCGDIFDRGPKTKEMYDYLRSIPRERRILVRGNHEDMFIELLKKDYPDNYDFQNKTVRTFCQLAGFDEDCLKTVTYLSFEDSVSVNHTVRAYWKQIVEVVKNTGIVEWLKSDEWVNFYELDRFIFVHSFIPLIRLPNLSPSGDMQLGYNYSYSSEWRTNFTEHDWNSARWGCPWKLYFNGYFQQEEDLGKTLVCGHWHTSDFHRYLGKDYSDNMDIFFSKGIIALDGGVMIDYDGSYYHPCNILIIDNGKCYDKDGNEFKLEDNNHEQQ